MDSCDATFDILKKLSHAGVLQVFGLTLFFFGGGAFFPLSASHLLPWVESGVLLGSQKNKQ